MAFALTLATASSPRPAHARKQTQQPATVQQQPAADAPTALYPIRFAAHAAPAPGSPKDGDLVIGGGGRAQGARLYPLNLLWDEGARTVSDELGRAPIAVTLCPLAGVGTAFSRRSPRGTLELGHVSVTERDTLVLYDEATRSRWGLLSGEAFQGPMTGTRLERLPTLQTTWAHWKAVHPETSVYVAPDQADKGFQLDEARIRRVVLTGFWHSWKAHHPDTEVMGLSAQD